MNSGKIIFNTSERFASSQNLKNILFESDHTEPPSILSPFGLPPSVGDCEQKMTQIPAKKNTVSQATPLVKKRNSSRRSSRSRSRSRYSRRPTPPRSLVSQTIKTDSVEKLLPTTVRRLVPSVDKENSTPFKNQSSQAPAKSNGTTFGTEKPMRLASRLVDRPYVLTFIYFLVCVLYAFIIYKAVSYFGVDRFVIKHWTQWSKKIRFNLSP